MYYFQGLHRGNRGWLVTRGALIHLLIYLFINRTHSKMKLFVLMNKSRHAEAAGKAGDRGNKKNGE